MREHLAGRNGLNAVRLVLAVLVLVSHSWPLSGRSWEPSIGSTTIGTVAVAGFFGISGYLITGSRLALPLGRFAWHRVLRIFPAYVVQLVVVAFALAPAVSAIAGERWQASIAARYVAANATTHLGSLTLPGTLLSAPYVPGCWNGSAWTLQYELACYVAAGVAFVVPVFRRDPRWTLAAAGVVAAANLVVVPVGEAAMILHFAALFAAGAALRLYADRVPASGWLAAASALAVVAACSIGELDSVGAFPAAYLALWVGGRWHLHLRHDLSYGVYVYAFPAQMALADLWPRIGPWRLLAAAAAVTAPLAAASWFLVERPAMRWKNARPRIPSQSATVIRSDVGEVRPGVVVTQDCDVRGPDDQGGVPLASSLARECLSHKGSDHPTQLPTLAGE